ncbi:NfeD family protein [uncultured Ramlibacter sp.]|uniref:NfeD family protein n=1 Tax=uncultured Ramlibacter sp. TaxID=260755 RepID=UPI0026334DA2|nr:NfeD family protein [uncultured Ramlibacter sp.]
MAESTIWWLATGLAVAVELVTGTFYLLMLAIGLAAAAVAAHLGASLTVQVTVAAVIGGGAVLACHLVRSRRPKSAPAQSNRNVNLDIGESVQVDAWNADGTATVKYRGAAWTVVPAPGSAQDAGMHRVREVVGNRLVVERI